MPKQIELKLLCDLDDGELQLKTQEVAACLGEIDEVDARKSAANKDFRREMQEINERMRRVAYQVRTKTESRMVACTVEFHVPQIGYKRTTRLDTGEIVREDPMTDEEREARLFGDASVKERPAASPKEKKSKRPQAEG
jgi:hypothetical protein